MKAEIFFETFFCDDFLTKLLTQSENIFINALFYHKLSESHFAIIWYDDHDKYVVGSKSFLPDIQKPGQMENAVRDI